MRITGWLLLIVGALLCVSIVWAAIGFLMMGFGLICLLIAENRRKRAASVAEPPATPAEPRFQETEDRPPLAPPLAIPRTGMVSRAAVVASAVDQVRQGNSSYDTAKWDSLVMSDPDIARLVEALTPYGRQYADELAAAYMALNDKSYLSLIVDEIIASARRTANQNRAKDVTVGASEPGGGRRSRPSELRSGRSRDLLRAAGVSREPAAIDQVVADADIGPVPSVADGNSVPAPIAVAAAREPEPEKTTAEAIVTVTPRPVPGTEAIRKADLDDAKDLRDLFKALGS
jgi:hypothetical protein